MKISFRSVAYAFILWCIHATALLAQFTPGHVVVLQAGDGSSPLINTGNKIVLREFSPLGAPAFSVSIPTAVNPLLIGGTASSEGALSLSQNGEYLIFGGYAQALPNTTVLAGSSASAINRGVGAVDAAGGYTRMATSASFFTGNNIRGAASDGNANFWASGSNNGTDYFGLNSVPLTVQNSVTNTRCISVVSGSLYFSCGSGSFGIYRAGSGLPFTSGQGATAVITTTGTGTGSSSPYGFYFNTGLTVCYVADDRNPANGGGIQKWVYSSGTWSLAYTLGTGANYGARGVVADFSGPVPKVYATTSEGSLNRLVAINDAGAGSTATTLATAAANSLFRGLAFSPYCSNPQISAINSSSPACVNHSLSLNAVTIGPGPFTYTWSGPGGYTSSAQNPAVLNPISGNYSLTLANGCGSAKASASVTVHSLPQLTVNAPTICTGGTAVLSAGGASTYTWSNGNSGSTCSVSPAATGNFTVTGASLQGCETTMTTTVYVVSTLVLSANSVSVCEGSATTLSVSGAGSYTWSQGIAAPTITVAPAISTVYSVTGNSSGCISAASTTVMVTVLPLPVMTVNSATVCANTSVTLTASGASTYSWSNNAVTPTIQIIPSINKTYTVIGYSSFGCTAAAVAIISVMPLPSVSLAPLSISPVCLNSAGIILNGSPPGGVYSGQGVSGNVFSPLNPGVAAVFYTITDANNCSQTANRAVVVEPCTGIEELPGQVYLRVYPVPAVSFLFVQVNHMPGPFVMDVFNHRGSIICSRIFESNNVVLDVSAYEAGMYFVQLRNDHGEARAKFIKQ